MNESRARELAKELNDEHPHWKMGDEGDITQAILAFGAEVERDERKRWAREVMQWECGDCRDKVHLADMHDACAQAREIGVMMCGGIKEFRELGQYTSLLPPTATKEEGR